ncbi:MAG: hypothetical protein KAX05_01510 [Bacteroidales bacterium]|nr:hypothetical protein [Bacteroidales bacterium]
MNNLALIFGPLVWISFFAALVLAWYFYLKARNKERMALIEKGVDVSEFYTKSDLKFRFPWLKIGIIVTGISIGFALGLFIIADPKFQFEGGPVILATSFFFGGISIIIAYFVDKPQRKRQNGRTLH